MTHITPAHAHMNIIQANNYSCSFFVVANLAKQLSNFKLKNIFYPWHLDNFRKWHIKAISPDVWRPEEQICRYSDIHSRKKNRKKTPSTTPFSITYEVAKCCCWISHFFEMPRPPLASSRHVAWPRIALTMLKKASNLKISWHFKREVAPPPHIHMAWDLAGSLDHEQLAESIYPPEQPNSPTFLNRKYIYNFWHILWRLPVCYISIFGKHVTYSWWSNSVLGAQPRESPKWSDLKDLKYWQWVPPNNWRNLNFPNKLKS